MDPLFCSGLPSTNERRFLVPAMEMTANENAHGSDRAGRTYSNAVRVHKKSDSAQAYGSRVTKCTPITRKILKIGTSNDAYAGENPLGQKN